MILVIENNVQELEQTKQLIQNAYPENDVVGFTHPMFAVKFMTNNPVDAVFTPAVLKLVDSHKLVMMIRQTGKSIPVYVVAESEIQGTEIEPDGVLLRPLDKEQILNCCGEIVEAEEEEYVYEDIIYI